MVKIRLSRAGRKGYPTYKIIVSEAREKRDSKYIEQLGHYNPHTKELVLTKDRAEYWIGVGAQPTDTVRYMLVKEGVLKKSDLPKKAFKKTAGKKSTERTAAKAEKTAAAEEVKAEEAPKEEPAEEKEEVQAEAEETKAE